MIADLTPVETLLLHMGPSARAQLASQSNFLARNNKTAFERVVRSRR
jgi:hypothetical protein